MTQRQWCPPKETANAQLYLYNSLVDKKVPFIPIEASGKRVTWYTCGPTVYDAAHMGHARNYVSFDVVRRVLEDYFGYDCLFVMNVTDVDDKIILRARRGYLLEQYKNEQPSLEQVMDDATRAVQSSLKDQEDKLTQLKSQLKEMEESPQRDQRKITEMTSLIEQESLKLTKHKEAAEKLTAKPTTLDACLNLFGGYIAEALDKTKGEDVTDQSIFRAHAAKYEQWNRPMAYGESSKEEVKAKESALKNFFQNVAAVIRDTNPSSLAMRWEDAEMQLQSSFTVCQQTVHASLCDNVNTRGAMDAMLDCIKVVNIYLSKKQEISVRPHPFLLKRIAGYLTKMLSTFGIVDAPGDGMGWTTTGDAASDGTAYLDAFAAFRDEVRSLSRDKADHKDLLTACDRVRDTTLVSLGVRLEDRSDGSAIWKLDDPEVLKAEIEQKAAIAKEQLRKKLRNKLELKMKEKERFEKAFELPSKYTRYDDETGYPTHDKDDKALEGKALDNARKDFDKFKKKRAPMEQKLADNPQYLENLDVEIQDMERQLSEHCNGGQ